MNSRETGVSVGSNARANGAERKSKNTEVSIRNIGLQN